MTELSMHDHEANIVRIGHEHRWDADALVSAPRMRPAIAPITGIWRLASE